MVVELLCGGGSLCVHIGVRAHTRVPCVSVPCAPGPSYSCTHVHPAKCTPVSLSCLPCLCPCLAREPLGWPLAVGRPWPSWHMSPLTLSMHVPGWGSPLVFLLCVGMCGCMNRIPVSLLAGVCLCMCVPSLIWVSVSVPAWVARVCLDVGGVQGGEGVSVCVLLGILLYMKHLWARPV